MSSPDTPDTGWEVLRAIALRISEQRAVEVPLEAVAEHVMEIRRLVDVGVLVERAGLVRFSHETLLDHVLARAFVEDGRSLIDDVLSRRQDLSRRPLLRRILVFERGLDRARYRQSVRALIGNPAVRFHLRDVVFDVMRDDTAPEAPDWDLIASMVVDPENLNHTAAWNVAIQPAYLRVIDTTGTLLRWMVSEHEPDRDRATSLLPHLLRSDPGRAAVLMWAFLDLGAEWHNRLRWVLPMAAPEGNRRLVDFLLAALEAGVFDDPSHADAMWLAALDLPTKRPQWAAELLAAYLRRAAQRAVGGNMFELTVDNDSYHAEELIRSLSRRAPAPFARAVLPTVIAIVEESADPTRTLVQGDPWVLRYSTRGHGVDDALFESLDGALRTVAAKQPNRFGRFASDLIPRTDLHSLRFLLYRAWSANPSAFWGPALDHLLSADGDFVCGYLDSPYWVTRELIGAIQEVAPKAGLHELEERILGFYSERERSADGRATRGLGQLTLLDAFSDRKLSDNARRRRDELRRKLGPSERSAPRGIQVGIVGSPIPDDKAQKMTDRSWLRAIRRYGTNERSGPDFMKGGAVQLSRVLEQQAKLEPARFASLALRFPAETNHNYVEAILRGLGAAEHPVDPEVLIGVLRHFFAMPGHPGGRWFTQPLAQIADKQIPFDVLDMVSWFATEAPDPSRDTWRKTSDDEVEYYGGDPFTAGINSVRGAAAEAISVLIWPNAERLAYLGETLERLVRDPVVAVRVCAAVTLRTAYRHEADRAVELFLELCDSDDALLATRPVEDFLSVATKTHLEQLLPVLSRMVSVEVADTQSAGGRQVALAALSDERAHYLVEAAMDGPPAVRLGVAQVAAHNVMNEEVGDTCARWLPVFFNDADQAVREAASDWVRQLGPTGIRQRPDLVNIYIESAAYRDDESDLLHVLDDSTVPIVDIALPALQRFVDQRRGEMGDFQRGAAYAATFASKLATRAYASADTADRREQALDIIDALLAAKVSDVREFVESFG
jgi:hypothetical protein